MLLIWPLVARQFDVRMDPARELIWTLLAGYLILPPVLAINLPLVPDFTKNHHSQSGRPAVVVADPETPDPL